MAAQKRLSAFEKRQRAERAGRRAEIFAALWLMIKGYRVLAWRFRTQEGEVDLIARRGSTLIFVEVKARSTHEEAIWAVTPQNEARVSEAAVIWLAQNAPHYQGNIRYDVITFAKNWPKHHKDAWRPGWNQHSVNQGRFF
ncbi:MAG: YraN family protein [Pseudomonadota bacterium]